MKAYWGSGGHHAFTDLGTRWRWVISFTPRPFYPEERLPGTHWIGGWVGPSVKKKHRDNFTLYLYLTINEVLLENLLVLLRQSRNSRPFMELVASLPCLQEPASDPCPEPDSCSPHFPILFPLRSVLILSYQLTDKNNRYTGYIKLGSWLISRSYINRTWN
jgi:hypothetical protein